MTVSTHPSPLHSRSSNLFSCVLDKSHLPDYYTKQEVEETEASETVIPQVEKCNLPDVLGDHLTELVCTLESGALEPALNAYSAIKEHLSDSEQY